MKRAFAIASIIILFFVISPISVKATQNYTEAPANSWINLLSNTGNTNYLLHNSSDNNNLEFAAYNNGTMQWQILNINKNGTVSVGSNAIAGSKFQVNTSSNWWAMRAVNTNTDVRLGFPGHGIYVNASNGTGYLMQLNNNGEKFRINADGRTYVDNILTAKEIRVRTNVWADNVFDDEYELMSLSDVENYINENNHLPKVPSEAEIVSGELNVGEMQRLQMEKIEELTLYVIEQEKEIKDLNERLERLELLVQN